MTEYINTKVMLTGKKQVGFERSPVPAVGARHILIRNDYSVMNLGTEMTMFSGDFPPGSWWDNWVKYPISSGWGSLGTVIEVGAEVSTFQAGDRVAADGEHERYTLVSVDSRDAPQKIPAGVTDDQAGLWSISRVSMHGVRVAKIDIGEAVVVIGQGIVGQLALRFARVSGALPLIAVDMAESRLNYSKIVPDTILLQGPIDALLDEIIRLNKGRKVDCVLEVTGNPVSIPQALKLPRKRGRLIVLGSPRGISMVDFHDQIHFGVDVIGAQWSTYPPFESHLNPWTTARNGELYFDLLKAGMVNVDGLISHTFNWREAPEVFPQIYDDRTRFMAVRYDWRDCD